MASDVSAAPRPRLNLGLLQTLATAVLVVFILYAARIVIIPVALAVFFVFILNPLVRYLERLGLPRTPAVLATMLAAASLVAGIGFIVYGQVNALAKDLPNYRPQIEKKLESVRGGGGTFSELWKMFDDLAQGKSKADISTTKPPLPGELPGPAAAPPAAPVQVETVRGGAFATEKETKIKPAETGGLASIAETVLPIVEPIANTGLVGILVVFMLVNREDLRNRLISLFGRGKVTGTTRVLADAAERVSKFLLFQLIVNAGFGLILAVGLYFIGVPYSPLWGFLSMLLRFIPFVGTWISALFPFLISFATSDGWTQPLMVFGFFAVLDVITANVVEPLLFGHQTGVSPIALLLAAAFWAWLWGPIGLLLATPITVCLAVIGAHVPKLKPLATLLGDKPALESYVSFYQRLLAKDEAEAGALATAAAYEGGPSPALATYDKVVLPALYLARRDRVSEAITAEEETYIFDTTARVVNEAVAPKLATEAQKLEAEKHARGLAEMPVVVGAPAHDRSEEVALAMLGSILPTLGRRLVALSSRQLPVEVEQAIETQKAAAVVVTIFPPGGVPQALYLVKRLRATAADLPIVVAYLGRPGDFDSLLVRFRRAGATHVVTTLSQAADVLKAADAVIPPTPEPAPSTAAGLVASVRQAVGV